MSLHLWLGITVPWLASRLGLGLENGAHNVGFVLPHLLQLLGRVLLKGRETLEFRTYRCETLEFRTYKRESLAN